MDEIKNMLDYKVGHYIKYEDISQLNKKYILRCRDDERVELWNRWTLEKEHVVTFV